ncbi:MAG: NAD(P)H oxidoreductase [Dongiaceae bacterium]
MNVLAVLAHPRRSSLTGAVLDGFVAGLVEAGHQTEIADLYREGFDPALWPEDEPAWDCGSKRYSDVVLAEQARIERNDAIALVFPVWWWSMPAMLKGWIDRVWNNGWAYGDRNLKGKRGLALALAANDADSYAKRGYDRAMDTEIRVGIFDYCGIENAPLHMLYNSTTDRATGAALIGQSRQIGRDFR